VKKIAFGLAALLISASPALAQVSPKAVAGAWHSATFVPKAADQSGRGFTIAGDVGVGIQHDAFFEATEVGLGGVNVSAGWFVSDKLAVMFRATGTRVTFSDANIVQTSGVIGGVIQYWVSDKIAIEAGAGSGWWSDDNNTSDRGFGLILGVQCIVWERGSHHLFISGEYLPVLTDSKVHNFAVTFGYQFFKKS
jgi:hypothetical protein